MACGKNYDCSTWAACVFYKLPVLLERVDNEENIREGEEGLSILLLFSLMHTAKPIWGANHSRCSREKKFSQWVMRCSLPHHSLINQNNCSNPVEVMTQNKSSVKMKMTSVMSTFAERTVVVLKLLWLLNRVDSSSHLNRRSVDDAKDPFFFLHEILETV